MNSTFATLNHRYNQRINAVLEEIVGQLEPSLLQEAMAYSLLAGGKRIRPFLVYATGEMFQSSLEKLDQPAAATELIHTYSLIHDDLPAMDNDILRRGMPTCHIKFGEDLAILAGDALQTLAFNRLTQAPMLNAETKVAMINELATASGASGMCLGQTLDLQAEHKQISLAQLKKIHHNKTGALIKASIRLGMFASGDAALAYQPQLDSYADAIGLAFQIQDDILDVVGDQKVMGKSSGSDLESEKSTYPSILGLQKAIDTSHDLYQQAIEQLDKIPYNSQPLRLLADFIVNRES